MLCNKKTSMFLDLLMVLLALTLIAGCGGNSSRGASNADAAEERAQKEPVQIYNEPPVEVIVTEDDPSLPSGCRPWQVAGLVTSFFEAFNEGDQDRLPQFFVPNFQTPGLYGLTEGKGEIGSFYTHDRDELLQYFDKRRDHGEKLRLLEVAVSESWRKNTVDIVYALTRHADDLKPGLGGPDRIAIGKGAIDCEKQRIIVWQMGMEMTEQDAQAYLAIAESCKKPDAWKPGEAVVACLQ